MGVRTQLFYELCQIEGVVFHIELTGADRNIAGIVPISDIDFTIGQQAAHGGAQERGVMSAHGSNQKHLAVPWGAARYGEMDQVAKRLGHYGFDFDQMIFAILG